MNKPVLIVIDMQSKFTAANDPETITECKRLIREAMLEKQMILFLEFKFNNKTLPQLRSLVRDYPFHQTLIKSTDDGSAEILSFFKRSRTQPANLVVCGVNTDCCVHATVLSLSAEKKFKITVVKKACNTVFSKARVARAIRAMKILGVSIV